jgi:hypothetical protein
LEGLINRPRIAAVISVNMITATPNIRVLLFICGLVAAVPACTTDRILSERSAVCG